MDRLTTRRPDGSVETIGQTWSNFEMCMVPCSRGNDKYDVRLAEYEDAGLTPEEISALRALIETHEPHGRNYTNEQYISLRAQLTQSQSREAGYREALEIAAGALILDAMVDNDGHPFGTTVEALDAVNKALASPGSEVGEEVRRLRNIEKAAKQVYEAFESLPQGHIDVTLEIIPLAIAASSLKHAFEDGKAGVAHE